VTCLLSPAGYSVIDAQRQPYPVLYLNDGQNLFGDCLTPSGSSWCAADAAAQLIGSGQLPPFVIVGVDHAGAQRSYEYTPCKPGTGPGGFRWGRHCLHSMTSSSSSCWHTSQLPYYERVVCCLPATAGRARHNCTSASCQQSARVA
jgi:hypothetical protein